MRLIYLAILVAIAASIAAGLAYASDDDGDGGTTFKDFSLTPGDTIVLKDYRVELVEIQSFRDGLALIRVSKAGSGLDEQRVLLEGSSNSFDGGPEKNGIAVQLLEIVDEGSSEVRLEYPESLGTPRKRASDRESTARVAPDLTIEESFDKSEIRVGDTAQATIRVKNVGTDTAYGVELDDRPPLPGFTYLAGYPPKIRSELEPGKADSAVYVVSAVKEGTSTVPSLDVRYTDSKKNVKTNSTRPFSVSVNPPRTPELRMIIGDLPPIREGEAGTLNVSLENLGDAPAYRVEVSPEALPQGLEVSGLRASYFEIEAGKSENYSAIIRGKENGNYTINVRISFQKGREDGSKGDLTVKSATAKVVVLEREYKYIYYLLLLPLAGAALWLFKRHREYKY